MKRTLLFTLLALFTASWTSAQTVTPANKLGWNQTEVSLAAAQADTYKYYADGATTGVALVSVTCTNFVAPDTSGFTCTVPFPAFTPGTHTLQLTASNTAGESGKSAVLTFTFVVVPGIPGNVRIQ